MAEEHASESDLLNLAGYKMRIPEAAILQRHLRRCRECNERYRAVTAGFPDALRIKLVDDQKNSDRGSSYFLAQKCQPNAFHLRESLSRLVYKRTESAILNATLAVGSKRFI